MKPQRQGKLKEPLLAHVARRRDRDWGPMRFVWWHYRKDAYI